MRHVSDIVKWVIGGIVAIFLTIIISGTFLEGRRRK